MARIGFTIWQLLGVLVIILVIAAAILPVFTHTNDHSRRPSCVLNQEELGLAVLQYTQDNDECMPNIADDPRGKNTWRGAILPYCKSKTIFQCPDRSDKRNGPDGIPRSYAANYTGDYSGSKSDQGDGAFAGPGSKPVSMMDIDDPAKLIVLCEVTNHNTPDFNIDNLAVTNPQNRYLWTGHTGGSYYQLADGHVKWYRPEETKDFWHRDRTAPLTPAALAILSEAQSRAGN